jgi:hypothetical protein
MLMIDDAAAAANSFLSDTDGYSGSVLRSNEVTIEFIKNRQLKR